MERAEIQYEKKKSLNVTIQKMINFDDFTKERIKENNPNQSQIPDHPYRILIIRGSGFGKTNSLFNLISQQPDIDKIYLYAKDRDREAEKKQQKYQHFHKVKLIK